MEGLLTSKPTLTPLVAGAVTTMITGTLVSQFDLPGKWVVIVVSLVLSLLIRFDKEVVIYQRILFYLLNSLTIFSVAMGINQAGVAATKSMEQHQYERRWVPESEAISFFHEWF